MPNYEVTVQYSRWSDHIATTVIEAASPEMVKDIVSDNIDEYIMDAEERGNSTDGSGGGIDFSQVSDVFITDMEAVVLPSDKEDETDA